MRQEPRLEIEIAEDDDDASVRVSKNYFLFFHGTNNYVKDGSTQNDQNDYGNTGKHGWCTNLQNPC